MGATLWTWPDAYQYEGRVSVVFRGGRERDTEESGKEETSEGGGEARR